MPKVRLDPCAGPGGPIACAFARWGEFSVAEDSRIAGSGAPAHRGARFTLTMMTSQCAELSHRITLGITSPSQCPNLPPLMKVRVAEPTIRLPTVKSLALGRGYQAVPGTIWSLCYHGAPSGPVTNRLNSVERSTGPATVSYGYLTRMQKLATLRASNSGMPGLEVPGPFVRSACEFPSSVWPSATGLP